MRSHCWSSGSEITVVSFSTFCSLNLWLKFIAPTSSFLSKNAHLQYFRSNPSKLCHFLLNHCIASSEKPILYASLSIKQSILEVSCWVSLFRGREIWREREVAEVYCARHGLSFWSWSLVIVCSWDLWKQEDPQASLYETVDQKIFIFVFEFLWIPLHCWADLMMPCYYHFILLLAQLGAFLKIILSTWKCHSTYCYSLHFTPSLPLS